LFKLCTSACLAALLERPVVLQEGQKREKKKVQRLEVTPPSTSKQKRLSLEEGSGTKLGDIPRIEFQLQKTHSEDLKPLHRLLFDRVGSVSRLLCLLLQHQFVVACRTEQLLNSEVLSQVTSAHIAMLISYFL